MEHAIRAEIHERLARNLVFYEKLTERLANIIKNMREQLIHTTEACQMMAIMRRDIQRGADAAAQYGMTTLGYAIYQLPESQADCSSEVRIPEDSRIPTEISEEIRGTSLNIEKRMGKYLDMNFWKSNHKVLRRLRRDIKRELRNNGVCSEKQLYALANQTVEMTRIGGRGG